MWVCHLTYDLTFYRPQFTGLLLAYLGPKVVAKSRLTFWRQKVGHKLPLRGNITKILVSCRRLTYDGKNGQTWSGGPCQTYSKFWAIFGLKIEVDFGQNRSAKISKILEFWKIPILEFLAFTDPILGSVLILIFIFGLPLGQIRSSCLGLLPRRRRLVITNLLAAGRFWPDLATDPIPGMNFTKNSRSKPGKSHFFKSDVFFA